MEDKQYLDEAGLGEVGKVISKFYASKDDIKDLDSLKSFVDKNSSMKFIYVAQSEWQSLDDHSKNFFITKTSDPYVIVALESKPESKDDFGIFDDDPIWIFNDEDVPREDKCGQPYLVVNLPLSDELNFNWFNKNGATGSTYQYKIQLALGLRDYVAYYQIVEAINGEIKYTNWSCLNDLYARKWIDKLRKEKNINKNDIINDLTTGGTDKVLSAEQGKVLNNAKADRAKMDILAKKVQLLQSYNDVVHHNPREIHPTYCILTGSYILQPYRAIGNLEELYRSYNNVNQYPVIGVMLVYKLPEWHDTSSSKVQIMQKIFDFNNQIVLWRQTLNYKEEYNDEWTYQHNGNDDFLKFCDQIQWSDWKIHEEDSQPWKVASSIQKGLMSAEDKQKLDAISVEDMKSLEQRVKALESKIH